MARAPKASETETVDADTGEVLVSRGGRAVTVAGPQASNITFGQVDMSRFSIKGYVSIPMLEIPPGQSFVAQLVDEVRILPPIEGHKPKYKDSAHYASTIKAPNGEARLFTWTTVFRTEMEKMFPNNAYVGEWFQITKLPIKTGKDYSTYAIVHLEVNS